MPLKPKEYPNPKRYHQNSNFSENTSDIRKGIIIRSRSRSISKLFQRADMPRRTPDTDAICQKHPVSRCDGCSLLRLVLTLLLPHGRLRRNSNENECNKYTACGSGTQEFISRKYFFLNLGKLFTQKISQKRPPHQYHKILCGGLIVRFYLFYPYLFFILILLPSKSGRWMRSHPGTTRSSFCGSAPACRFRPRCGPRK